MSVKQEMQSTISLYIRIGITKEGNVLFNDTLNTFYLRLYGVRHGKRPFIQREETHYRHYIGYCFLLTAMGRLYICTIP